MRRMLMLFAVALVMAAMVVVTAAPAFAQAGPQLQSRFVRVSNEAFSADSFVKLLPHKQPIAAKLLPQTTNNNNNNPSPNNPSPNNPTNNNPPSLGSVTPPDPDLCPVGPLPGVFFCD